MKLRRKFAVFAIVTICFLLQRSEERRVGKECT